MSGDPQPRSLADRILDCFPAGTYALSGLLRVLEIVETRKVETAAVECRIQPRLLINPDFVAAHAPTPEKLLMLVMHELHHVLLGHTTLFPHQTRLDNFVFDAVINGVICRMFPNRAYTALLTDYYDDALFPHCLLRPPPGWPAPPGQAHGIARGLQLLPARQARVAAELHAALYSEAGASYQEVFDALPSVLKKTLFDGITLLGDHPNAGLGSADGQLEQRAPLLVEVVREIVERWPQPPDPIRGRSLADVLQHRRGHLEHIPSYRAQLARLLQQVAGAGGGAGRRRAAVPLTVDSGVPSAHRRTLVLQSLGLQPLLHPHTLRAARRPTAIERVHVYVDVSGSLAAWIPRLYGAVLDCREWIHPRIHLFSTEIVDVDWQELRAAHIPTTGGTSIDCVIAHLIEQRVRCAVVLTDGAVGRPDGRGIAALQRVRLGVALTGADSPYNDLAAYTDFSLTLKEPSHA